MADRDAEIVRLERELDTLMASWNLVKSRQFPELPAFSERMSAIRQERLESINAYHEAEIAAADTNLKGTLYAIENDYERSLGIATARVQDFVQMKFDLLAQEMPEAADYYRTYQNSCPFLGEIFQGHKIPDSLSVSETSEPILSKHEINMALSEIASNKRHIFVEKGVLFVGDAQFNIGDSATIDFGSAVSSEVIIELISDAAVAIRLPDGVGISIPVIALDIGLVELSQRQ
jgi:hypothetical protein